MFVCLSFGLGWHQVLSKKGTQDWLRFFWHTGYLTSFWRWIMHCHICIAYMCGQCARRDARQELFDLAHAYLNDEWLFAISRFVAYIGALQFYEFLLHRKVFFLHEAILCHFRLNPFGGFSKLGLKGLSGGQIALISDSSPKAYLKSRWNLALGPHNVSRIFDSRRHALVPIKVLVPTKYRPRKGLLKTPRSREVKVQGQTHAGSVLSSSTDAFVRVFYPLGKYARRVRISFVTQSFNLFLISTKWYGVIFFFWMGKESCLDLRN